MRVLIQGPPRPFKRAQLLLTNRPQACQQLLRGGCVLPRPLITFTEPTSAQSPRKTCLQPELKTQTSTEVLLPLRILERFIRRQIGFEHHIPVVLHTRHGHIPEPGCRSTDVPQRNPNPVQSHALRLPVRQRPRQRQRKLLSAHVLLAHRICRFTVDRNPVPLLWLVGEI